MHITGEDALDRYKQYVSGVDREFRRVHDKFANRMQCRSGCSMCCSQMFSISLIEAAYISRAVKAMAPGDRDRLRSAARSYVEQAKHLTGTAGKGTGEESLVPVPGLRFACPALENDACSIYGARPIICRKWGIPIFNPKKPLELQACELNFSAGEEIDVEGLIEPQVELLEQWVQLKNRAKRDLNHVAATATVAEAILGDYEQLLLDGSTQQEPIRDDNNDNKGK
ncbi:MAG TPA: YkgJ family cysteine cluster protein [Blastocatellia bacterium]|nr:YkgJ family cysteine cluster protein [Blastocatellia bacterium]